MVAKKRRLDMTDKQMDKPKKKTGLLESYEQIFISFLLLTDLDAVFNGLY